MGEHDGSDDSGLVEREDPGAAAIARKCVDCSFQEKTFLAFAVSQVVPCGARRADDLIVLAECDDFPVSDDCHECLPSSKVIARALHDASLTLEEKCKRSITFLCKFCENAP